ncbi:MAG TPA: DUF6249 domain-containing protein [Candidatus Cybelea sp.]|jgi:hypothetical protein|nr:DUF6249 domain-containing protein [Candidatus Cybelea sp.]
MDDNIVAALVVTIVFGFPCAVWLISRVLGHQERMEMLRRGFVPPPDSREMRRAMKRGWVPGGQTGPSVDQYEYQTRLYAQVQLRRGIQVAFIGFALLIGLGFIGYRGDGIVVPGPWLLGGLIPLFVGVAQIVSAVLSGASLGVPVRRQYTSSFGPSAAPPEPPGQSTMPPGPTYGGWRPGPIPEIEKPASPPDYRG